VNCLQAAPTTTRMALVGTAAIGSTDPLTKQAKELGVSGGSIDHAAEVQAHSLRARTLAGEGKLVDAEAAFEEAIAVANREGAPRSPHLLLCACLALKRNGAACPRRTSAAGAARVARHEEARAGWPRQAKTPRRSTDCASTASTTGPGTATPPSLRCRWVC
jgi:hypothetical protein